MNTSLRQTNKIEFKNVASDGWRQLARSFVRGSVEALPFKKHLFSILRPFKPPKRLWHLLVFSGKFKVAVDGQRSFMINHSGNGTENGIFWSGLFGGFGEREPLKLWVELCAQASVILDIGANIGIYSLVAKTVSRQAQVHGFEPVAHLHQKFRENCRVNNFTIGCHHLAMSDVDGLTNIYIQPGGLLTASLNRNSLRTLSERIETMTLSSFIESQKIRKVDLMKIDVEGHETEVLKGIGDYLVAMKPTIIIEILSQEVAAQVEALVKNCNYAIFNIDELKGPIRQDGLSIEGKGRHSRNFLLCTEEVALRTNLL